MTKQPGTVRGLGGLWAGVALGGSLVAAPAKFQSTMLTLPVALDVGRLQFFWVGVTEAVLCLAFLAALVTLRNARWWWPLSAVALFAVQRVAIMPVLDARTLRVIAGEAVPPNWLHVGFIALEIIKFVLLCGIALGILRVSGSKRIESPEPAT